MIADGKGVRGSISGQLCVHGSHGWFPARTYTRTCTCIPVVLSFLSLLPVCCLCICFPGCHGGEGREEGKKEGEFGGGLGRKEEDMSVAW